MRMRSDSREWLPAEVTANVVLDAQPVYIAVELWGSTAEPTWHEAEWVGVAGAIRTAQILVGPGGTPSVTELAPGTYRVLVKVTDTPEIPTFEAFLLRVTS